jgi:hypothetical protein
MKASIAVTALLVWSVLCADPTYAHDPARHADSVTEARGAGAGIR